MAKQTLPIKHSYVPAWGVWEGVREIVQNALDEQDQHGNPYSITYDATACALRVANAGATMDGKALLLGETSKADDGKLRGHFGEGLNLALLCLVRAGYAVRIDTPTEVWVPSIEASELYGGERVLCVTSRKKKATHGPRSVTVTITGLKQTEWDEIKPRFLALMPDTTKIYGGYYGNLLTDDHMRGAVYVKGIFVQKIEGMYGYDLLLAETDRDRKMVKSDDLSYHARYIMTSAADAHNTTVAADLYAALKQHESSDEVMRTFGGYEGNSTFLAKLLDLFVAEHGKDAIPVSTMSDCVLVQHHGSKGVIVPTALRRMLERAGIGTLAAFTERHQVSVIRVYSLDELTTEEQWTYQQALELLTRAKAATNMDMHATPLDERVRIVDFYDEALEGRTILSANQIEIARTMLAEGAAEFMEVLVHEEAHAMTGTSDGDVRHVRGIEKLWAAIYRALLTD